MDQFQAARMGDLQQLRATLTVYNVNYAASHRHAECTKLCIEMCANVNARSCRGSTPLHFASSHGRGDVARMLLDAGAMVDATDNEEHTPLYLAIHNDNVNMARLLIDGGGKVSNVILNQYDLQGIPDWAATFIASRTRCRDVAIVVIGIHKYHCTLVTVNNDINVLRLVSKYIWSTRMDNAWLLNNSENED
jgi:ankyrin repeat protein